MPSSYKRPDYLPLPGTAAEPGATTKTVLRPPPYRPSPIVIQQTSRRGRGFSLLMLLLYVGVTTALSGVVWWYVRSLHDPATARDQLAPQTAAQSVPSIVVPVPAPEAAPVQAAVQPAPAPQASTHDAGTGETQASASPVPRREDAARPDPVAPPRAVAAPTLPAEEIAALVARGDRFLKAGDIASARLFYQRAAEAGDGHAALFLGATYDPNILARAGLRAVDADAHQAVAWYLRARELGETDAGPRLEALIDKDK